MRLSAKADIRAAEISHNGFASTYTVNYKGDEIGQVTLRIPGLHNIKNSLVAVCIGRELGIPFPTIKKALESFSGVYRRFEVKYNKEIMVVDDYAHHPTETTATLSAVRAGWKRRLVAVFQPHLYTRTRDFYQEFGRSFLNSDIFVCTDIYPAREQPIEGISGKLIADAAKNFGHKNVFYIQDKNEISRKLKELRKEISRLQWEPGYLEMGKICQMKVHKMSQRKKYLGFCLSCQYFLPFFLLFQRAE
jgi:UDP-N-acetylmuramate--alanine ligase